MTNEDKQALMPVLTEKQREADIQCCFADIEELEITLRNGSSDTPHLVESALRRQKIALAALKSPAPEDSC